MGLSLARSVTRGLAFVSFSESVVTYGMGPASKELVRVLLSWDLKEPIRRDLYYFLRSLSILKRLPVEICARLPIHRIQRSWRWNLALFSACRLAIFCAMWSTTRPPRLAHAPEAAARALPPRRRADTTWRVLPFGRVARSSMCLLECTHGWHRRGGKDGKNEDDCTLDTFI